MLLALAALFAFVALVWLLPALVLWKLAHVRGRSAGWAGFAALGWAGFGIGLIVLMLLPLGAGNTWSRSADTDS